MNVGRRKGTKGGSDNCTKQWNCCGPEKVMYEIEGIMFESERLNGQKSKWQHLEEWAKAFKESGYQQ